MRSITRFITSVCFGPGHALRPVGGQRLDLAESRHNGFLRLSLSPRTARPAAG
jgi:hypothetical protein